MSNEKFEREFEAFLSEEQSRLGMLYRKLPQAEPDPLLDATVRAMARQALDVAAPQGNPRRRRARWVPALGAAAGLVLAAGIALRLGPSAHRDGSEIDVPANNAASQRSLDGAAVPEPPSSPVPPQVQGAQSRAESAKLQSAPARGVDAPPKPTGQAPAVREKAASLDDSADRQPEVTGELSKTEKATAGRNQPQAFPQPAQARQRASELDAAERRQNTTSGDLRFVHDRDGGAAAGGKVPAAAATDDKGLAAPATAAAPLRRDAERAAPALAPAVPAQASAPAESAVPRSTAPAPVQQESPARPPPMPPSSASKPALKTQTVTGNAVARDALAGASDETKQKKEDQRLLRSSDPNSRLYPEHWLQNIRAMLLEHRRDEALRSLGEFRRLYPDYHLPEDLRDLK